MTPLGHGVISAAETGRTTGERRKIDRRMDGWMDDQLQPLKLVVQSSMTTADGVSRL